MTELRHPWTVTASHTCFFSLLQLSTHSTLQKKAYFEAVVIIHCLWFDFDLFSTICSVHHAVSVLSTYHNHFSPILPHRNIHRTFSPPTALSNFQFGFCDLNWCFLPDGSKTSYCMSTTLMQLQRERYAVIELSMYKSITVGFPTNEMKFSMKPLGLQSS